MCQVGFRRNVSIHTVIHGVLIRFWPTLLTKSAKVEERQTVDCCCQPCKSTQNTSRANNNSTVAVSPAEVHKIHQEQTTIRLSLSALRKFTKYIRSKQQFDCRCQPCGSAQNTSRANNNSTIRLSLSALRKYTKYIKSKQQ